MKKLGIVQSDLSSDTEFLRRVRLDMTGTLPTAKEVEEFLADQSPNKRQAKIEQLLESPAYAAWWTTKLCDLTGNTSALGPQGGEQSLNREKARQWYEWIYRQFLSLSRNRLSPGGNGFSKKLLSGRSPSPGR